MLRMRTHQVSWQPQYWALPRPGRDFDSKFAYWNETKTKMSADTGVAEVYDVVVVGAGVEGSATAYHLASHLPRKKILLLEQVRAYVHHSMILYMRHVAILPILWA